MLQGSCLCGDVEFEITGYFSPVQNCHAARCRKATGGVVTPEMLAHRKGFRWTKGKEQVRVYTAPLLKSPPAYARAFCESCGSPLPVALEGTPYMILNSGVIDVAPGDLPLNSASPDAKACWHEIMDEIAPSKGHSPSRKQEETQRVMVPVE